MSAYFDEPYYQDGLVAQAMDHGRGARASHISPPPETIRTCSYENTAPNFATLSSTAPNSGELPAELRYLGRNHHHHPAGDHSADSAGLFPGAWCVEWDQPYITGAARAAAPPASSTCASPAGTGSDTITDYDGNAVSCTGPNALGADSYQIMIIGQSRERRAATRPSRISTSWSVWRAAASRPGRLIVTVGTMGLGSQITHSPPIARPSRDTASPRALRPSAPPFTFRRRAAGPRRPRSSIIRRWAGRRFCSTPRALGSRRPMYRQKPDFVGPDGTNDTFLGFTWRGRESPAGLLSTTITECQNNPNYPNFFGTSAATPHAAGIAALHAAGEQRRAHADLCGAA